jgi:hypothetical protein
LHHAYHLKYAAIPWSHEGTIWKKGIVGGASTSLVAAAKKILLLSNREIVPLILMLKMLLRANLVRKVLQLVILPHYYQC